MLGIWLPFSVYPNHICRLQSLPVATTDQSSMGFTSLRDFCRTGINVLPRTTYGISFCHVNDNPVLRQVKGIQSGSHWESSMANVCNLQPIFGLHRRSEVS